MDGNWSIVLSYSVTVRCLIGNGDLNLIGLQTVDYTGKMYISLELETH